MLSLDLPDGLPTQQFRPHIADKPDSMLARLGLYYAVYPVVGRLHVGGVAEQPNIVVRAVIHTLDDFQAGHKHSYALIRLLF
jgi:hypothetical protein